MAIDIQQVDVPAMAPIPLDNSQLLADDLPGVDDARKATYRVEQRGGIELVQLAVEGEVGEIDVGADPNATRTYAFWMPKSDLFIDPAAPEKGMKSWEQVMSEHGLPEAWGFRTRIGFAVIPEGAEFSCTIRRAAPVDAMTPSGVLDQTAGGGIEFKFERGDFIEDWRVFDREDPARAELFERLARAGGPYEAMRLLSNEEVRGDEYFDRRYRGSQPRRDASGAIVRDKDGRYMWDPP